MGLNRERTATDDEDQDLGDVTATSLWALFFHRNTIIARSDSPRASH